jgi:phosphatidate phosphatase APP1
MARWKRAARAALHRPLHAAEVQYDTLKWRLKRRFGWLAPLRIQPYRGFGNHERISLMGRVLENKAVGSPKDDARWWQNVRAMVNRFATDEAPGARVRGEFQGASQETVTDDEGYFSLEFPLREPLADGRSWHEVQLQLIENEVTPGRETPKAEGFVLVPSPDAAFGVISDIDDTVMKSSATNFWRMARLTFLNNARTRKPFQGVAAFYRALAAGPQGGDGASPFFYVSSSPWNLYDLIHDFLELNEIPLGPILLRDLGLDKHKFIKEGHEHKLDKIQAILGTIPDLPFLLIGDSGQDDPTLYREAIRRFPGRIRAVYIRDIAAKNRTAVEELAAEARADNVEMLLVADSYEAARHAADRGLIASNQLDEIHADREQDRTSSRPAV